MLDGEGQSRDEKIMNGEVDTELDFYQDREKIRIISSSLFSIFTPTPSSSTIHPFLLV